MPLLNRQRKKCLRVKVSIFFIFFMVVAAPAGWSQIATPRACPSRSSGPFGGGMCDLGSLTGAGGGFSFGESISADGGTIVGLAESQSLPVGEAYIWKSDDNGILGLGALDRQDPLLSFATAVNADGTVVVGQSLGVDTLSGNLSARAFRWIEGNTVLQDLGSLRTNTFGDSYPEAISADGTVVAGFAETDRGDSQAFRWTEAAGMQSLGSLRADGFGASAALAINSDGSVVVGDAETDSGGRRAFRWTDSTGRMQDLGTLRADDSGGSEAIGVSEDGRIVVGTAAADFPFRRAFRWVEGARRMVDLGSLRGPGIGNSAATAVSRDGRVVVGSADTDDGFVRAFRSVDGAGPMQDLGSLRTDNSGTSEAVAVSDDGRVVVGNADTDDGATRAFWWIADTETIRDLGTLRSDNLGDSFARGVSSDGAIVIGEAETDDGNLRAFIWRTQIQDLGNIFASFGDLADDTAAAVAVQQERVGYLANQSCTSLAGDRCLIGTLTWDSNGAARNRSGSSASGYAGLLSAGYGVDEGITVGFTLGAGSSGTAGTIDAGTLFGGAIWAIVNAGGAIRPGFEAKIALAYGEESERMTRGQGLANVTLARAESDVSTRTAVAEIGYGIDTDVGWLITPTLALTHWSSRRAGYLERGSDTTARFSSLTVTRTLVSAALSGEMELTDKTDLRLTLGLDHDLQADTVTLNGTSNVPGMARFSIASREERRETRGFLETGVVYAISDSAFVSGNLRVGQPEFGDDLSLRIGSSFGLRF